MFKVTQTWGTTDAHAGGEASKPKQFDTLEELEAFLEEQFAEDKHMGFDIKYRIYEMDWVEREFEIGLRIKR